MRSEYGVGVYRNGVADFTEKRQVVVRIGIKPGVFIAAGIDLAAAPSRKVCHLAALKTGLPLWLSRVTAVNQADGTAQPVLKAKACGNRLSDDAMCGGHEQELITGNAVAVYQRKRLV
jgi:hypothetical protein